MEIDGKFLNLMMIHQTFRSWLWTPINPCQWHQLFMKERDVNSKITDQFFKEINIIILIWSWKM